MLPSVYFIQRPDSYHCYAGEKGHVLPLTYCFADAKIGKNHKVTDLL